MRLEALTAGADAAEARGDVLTADVMRAAAKEIASLRKQLFDCKNANRAEHGFEPLSAHDTDEGAK